MTNIDVHLLTVWNPAYADAMEDTLQLLLARAKEVQRHAAKRNAKTDKGDDAPADADDAYVWWGKLRSSNRQQPIPHLDQVLALDRDLEGDPTRELHLYITDYRSLYVAHVGEITRDDVRAIDAERHAVPSFYTKDMTCDCWFQLLDIRRLIVDDTVGVVEELKKLANTRYHDRPVSIYGGIVDLPLIVTRKDQVRYFDEDRDRLTDGQLWVQFDAQRTGVGQIERELRDNLLGESAWSGLEPAARSFIASAESLVRSGRGDRSVDITGAVVDFSKALESQVNHVLRLALRGLPERDRSVNIDGHSIDLARGRLLTLGQLAHAIGQTHGINVALRNRLVNGVWFAGQLPAILKELSGTRNDAAHSARIAAAKVLEIRNRLMGVGCQGVFVELGRVRLK